MLDITYNIHSFMAWTIFLVTWGVTFIHCVEYFLVTWGIMTSDLLISWWELRQLFMQHKMEFEITHINTRQQKRTKEFSGSSRDRTQNFRSEVEPRPLHHQASYRHIYNIYVTLSRTRGILRKTLSPSFFTYKWVLPSVLYQVMQAAVQRRLFVTVP